MYCNKFKLKICYLLSGIIHVQTTATLILKTIVHYCAHRKD